MTTTERRLPSTMQLLKSDWLPPEPETTVSKAKAAVAVIDATTASVRAELDEAEQREHGTAAELVAAATEGHDLAPILAAWRPGRAHAEQRLALLARARSLAGTQHDRAQRTDPAYLQWQADCRRIEQDWQIAMSGDPNHRVDALVEFANVH